MLLPSIDTTKKKRTTAVSDGPRLGLDPTSQDMTEEVAAAGENLAAGDNASPTVVATPGEGASAELDPGAPALTSTVETGSVDQGDQGWDMDQAFLDYAQAQFGDVDTADEEAALQAQSDRLMGQNLVDQRASMGRGGFAASGAMAALENTARADAARQLGLDVLGVRDREEQQRRSGIENAMRIDADKQRLANEQMLLEANLEAQRYLLSGQPDAPADGGGADGVSPDTNMGIDTGDSALGKGTDQTELAAAAENYPQAMNVTEGDDKTGTYTDADGQSWDVYESAATGNSYKVPAGG